MQAVLDITTSQLFERARHVLEMGGAVFVHSCLDRFGVSRIRQLTDGQLAAIVAENSDLAALENPYTVLAP